MYVVVDCVCLWGCEVYVVEDILIVGGGEDFVDYWEIGGGGWLVVL